MWRTLRDATGELLQSPASPTTSTRCSRSTGSRSDIGSGCALPTSPNEPFVEERRGTKVIPRLMAENPTTKPVFASMIRTSDRWCRVSITDLERHQLRLLRAELGLVHPSQPTNSTRRRKAAA
jgi:hypothetical protein